MKRTASLFIRARYSAVVLTIVAAAFLLYAYSTGINGRTQLNGEGCTCHGDLNSAVTVTILGPDTLQPNETAQYSVRISGGPLMRAGTNIAADVGTLGIANATLQLMGGELTHTAPLAPLSGYVEYIFTYTAPPDTGEANLYANGNSVNFDGSSGGDAWNFAPTRLLHIVNAPPVTTPLVQTLASSSVDTTSAVCGGSIDSDGGAAVSARGICWGTAPNPDISGSHTTNGTGNGNFSGTLTGLSPGTLYHFRAYATNSAGTSYGDDSSFTTPNPGYLYLTVIPQGFYDGANDRLTMKDTVKIYLANSAAPYQFIDSAVAVLDSVTCSAHCAFKSAANGNYYIVVRHRNTIETWSKSGGAAFQKGLTQAYNFSDSLAKAFGGNLKPVGTRFAVYSGDVNQDGIVDFSDLLLIDNDSFAFAAGYLATDLTGDMFVDFSDLTICENNSNNFISVVTPFSLSRAVKKSAARTIVRE
jgi:hypothetical protein